MAQKFSKNSEKNMIEIKHRLKFTPKASQDLDEIYNYITNNLFNESAAETLLEKIEKSIMNLKDFLQLGTFVGDPELKAKGYRKLIIENYIVFYLFNEIEGVVIIMRVLFGRQEYQNFI